MSDQASSRPWYAEHVDRYIETDGEDGHDWNGNPTLLLTTRGRRSGEPHTLPLIYGRDGNRLLVVAAAPRSTPRGTSTCWPTPRSTCR
jgi:hypothetical protein